MVSATAFQWITSECYKLSVPNLQRRQSIQGKPVTVLQMERKSSLEAVAN